MFDIDNIELLLNELNDNVSDELTEIMSKYNSDKGGGLAKKYIESNIMPPNLVCHNYTFFYNKLFNLIRNENINIFEMGVGVPPCMGVGSWAGSLLGWEEYFPNSKIFSADFDKNYLYNSERIKSYYVDQEDSASIKLMWTNLTEYTFDLMIDDGPHTYNSNFLFYINSINKLKNGGLYIIEDIDLNFIDKLYNNIITFNLNLSDTFQVKKLIIPYPKKFIHSHGPLMRMNNLIFIKKL